MVQCFRSYSRDILWTFPSKTVLHHKSGRDRRKIVETQRKKIEGSQLYRQLAAFAAKSLDGRQAHIDSICRPSTEAITKTPNPPVQVDQILSEAIDIRLNGSAASPRIKWGSGSDGPLRTVHQGEGKDRCVEIRWTSVRINGVLCSVGDAADIVVEGDGIKQTKIGLICQLLQIKYDHARRDKQRVHVQWLRESDLAEKGELFLAERQCETLGLSRIRKKFDFKLIEAGDSPDRSTTYLARFIYEASPFVLRNHLINASIDCDSCHRREAHQDWVSPRYGTGE